MNDIIREALESYKSLAEDMHDTVCQSFSDDVDRAIKAIAALDAAPTITAEDAALLMELMQAALQGDQLALLGRLSEHELYNKLATLTGNKETI